MRLTAAAGSALTPRQREAVDARAGNVLVEAVPGAGKTRVIVARCEALVADGVPAARILVLTFSRRAVAELRERLRLRFGDAPTPDVRTFHGFAARVLAETSRAGHSRRLLTEPGRHALFARAVAATALRSLPAGTAGSAHFRTVAEDAVAALRRAPAALADLAADATPRIADLLALYAAESGMRARLGVADYDELVARCVERAADPRDPLATVLRTRYAHVLVDEYQDTDPLQLALLASFRAGIFAVGDAAQAIYGFRGAARDALERARAVLGMSTVALDESFRCPPEICDVARQVWPVKPELRSRVTESGRVTYRRAASPADEAIVIADAVAAARADGCPDSEIAVLVRGAEPAARLVEAELRARGIAVAGRAGERVFDDPAVDAVAVALRAFAEPEREAGWVDVLGHPVFGGAAVAIRLACATAPPRGVDEAAALAARTGATRLAAGLRAAHACWVAGDAVAAARLFAGRAGVLSFIAGLPDAAAQRSSGRLSAFLEALADVADVERRLDSDRPAAVVDALLNGGAAWRATPLDGADEPGVRILTVHGAKGLEFEFVAVADAVEGRFPLHPRPDELLADADLACARAHGVDLGTRAAEHLAQERALWYVAATRAKRELLVTWSETALDGTPQRPSTFIPLDARTAAAAAPSFRGVLRYRPAVETGLPRAAIPARLTRPLPTTAIQSWFTCRRQFYYATLLRIGSDDRTFVAKAGTLVHAAIAEFHTNVSDFRAVVPGAHVAWCAALQRAALATLERWRETPRGFSSPLETSAARRVVNRLLDRYARDLEATALGTPGGFEIVAREEHVAFVVGGVAFTGTVDRVDRFADGKLRLVDIKTGALARDRSMRTAFPKLATYAANGKLWTTTPAGANPQLALYRHAFTGVAMLAYIYLGARPKPAEYSPDAQIDRLDYTDAGDVSTLDALDGVLGEHVFRPWTEGRVTSLEPTAVARTCRRCEFVDVCPGYLEDDE